jgi:hypothetical protein
MAVILHDQVNGQSWQLVTAIPGRGDGLILCEQHSRVMITHSFVNDTCDHTHSSCLGSHGSHHLRP